MSELGYPVSLSLEAIIFPPVPTALPGEEFPTIFLHTIISKKLQKKESYLDDYFWSWEMESLGETEEEIYLYIWSYEISWVATSFQSPGQVVRATLPFFFPGT